MWATSYDRVHAHLSGVAGGLANKNSLRVHMTKFTVILITSNLKLKRTRKENGIVVWEQKVFFEGPDRFFRYVSVCFVSNGKTDFF